MRERYVQFKKFLKESWWDWWRWLFLMCLGSMGLATLILWWRFGSYPFEVYLGCFLGSVIASWLVMFLRKPMNKEFVGDR